VQSELFSVGAELATPEPEKHGTALVSDAHATALEHAIDKLEAHLPPLKQFILPDGCRGGALLHVARGVCRRAERRIVTLASSPTGKVSERIVRYMNRLGDYLFVAARFANAQAGRAESPWEKPS
jgi:cob(I)alamin adenosyltransferase